MISNGISNERYATKSLRTFISSLSDDDNKIVHAICTLLLINWIIFFSSGFKYSWAFFIFGPFLAIGFLLSNIFGIKYSITTFVYLSVVNSILFTTGIGFMGTLIEGGNYNHQSIIWVFSIFYLIALVISFRKRSQPCKFTVDQVRIVYIKHILLGVLVLIICYMSTQVIKDGGTKYLNYASYFLLALIIVYSISYKVNKSNAAIIILTVGIGMIWLRAFSTYDLFAGDGRHSARLAQLMIEQGISAGADGSRTSAMLSVRYLLPSLSLLMGKNVEFISQYILPTLAGISLLGVFSLNCNWLTTRDAIIASFILGTKTMFFTALIINFRTTFAFLVLVGFFIIFTDHNRSHYVLSSVFLIGVIGFHDTVGLFLISLLMIYTVVSYFSNYLIDNVFKKPKGMLLFPISTCIYYILFVETLSFEGIAIIISYTIITYIKGNGLDSRQDVASQADNISGSVAGTVFISSISIELLLAALATTLIIACWLLRDTAASRLNGFSATLSSENLIISNSILFGILVLTPRLGVHRVFLYSSPLLVGLISLLIRQLEKINLRYKIGSSYEWKLLVRILLALLIISSFINNVGFLFVLMGADGTEGPHIGAQEVDNYYFEKIDVETKIWIAEYMNQDATIYADYYGRNFLHSHPQIQSHEALPADKNPQRLDGCIFFRSGNIKSNILYINNPGNIVLEYENSLILNTNLTYSSGDTKISCSR